MRDFVTRPATCDDIFALVALMHDFYAESGHTLDAEWAAQSFASLIANPALGCIWLITANGEPAGHAVLTVRYAMEQGGLGGIIDDLYVKPKFRGRGAASAVLDRLFAEARARSCKSVQVEVGQSNQAALALYARYGLAAPTDDRISLSVNLANADV